MNPLIDKLDLGGYFASIETFFARSKPFFMEGDQNRHFEMIRQLDTLSFNPPKPIKELQNSLNSIKKQGILTLDILYEWVKLIRYMRYLTTLSLPAKLQEWMDEIVFPAELAPLEAFFHEDGTINPNQDETLMRVFAFLERTHKEVKASMQKHLDHTPLHAYLVDRQIHLVNDHETLLLKAGFHHELKGTIISRSPAGFFYVQPQSVEKIQAQTEHYRQEKEALLYDYAKKFSTLMGSWERFLSFLNKRFDLFDHYQARVLFARSKNYEFILPHKGSAFVVQSFAHPAIAHAKPVSIDASQSVVMITGVNAGGKTMLLKSLLSAVYLAKYLLPMKIDAHKSKIPTFKEVAAVIDDPQNVRNDISTFAGRMVEFSKLLGQKEALIGVDEIELGTDSDEAASLFKVLLEELIAKGSKIIVTTHHKRLAALMANRDDVTLIAALYDEVNRAPTYEFLQGSIGKSYAFETAVRYGIHNTFVQRAIHEYGVDQANLGELIERSSTLERELRLKHKAIDEKLSHITKLERIIEDEREHLHRELQGTKGELGRAYTQAIGEAKLAAKAHRLKEVHQHMNQAHENLPKKAPKTVKKSHTFSVGDSVRYLTNTGTILTVEGKTAHVLFESGMKMRVNLIDLLPCTVPKPKAPKVHVSHQISNKAALKLDLHGLRSDEALEKLDSFLSDALLQGWDEVIVFHGIGTGKLAYAVANYLKAHPSVKKFQDAPPAQGGYGAKIVTL